MTAELILNGRRIGDDTDCYVIAEIGHNHQGDLANARQLFRRARDCGVDAVKLQKRDNHGLFTAEMYASPYENENSFGPTYGAHREFLELDGEQYAELREYARQLDVTFFATAFDIPSADFLEALNVPAFKVASGDLTNLPLLRHVARIGKPMIISTGGADIDDVARAYDATVSINPQLAILQCTACYPTKAEHMNLRVIETYRARFPGAVIGLSDHFNGISMAVAAYVLGARIIEKHFTLDHTWKGTDHALSLEPAGMQKLVRDLRRARLAMGDGIKRRWPGEAAALMKMGKKIVAARRLPAGHVLAATDLAVKSPGDGLPPSELDRLVGRRLASDFLPDQTVTFELLELTLETART